MAKSAAFFDLDKTLMAGSSGMVFARVANRKGFVPRGQLAKWGFDHLRYRLRGSSDAQTQAVLDVAKDVFAEIAERDVERLGRAGGHIGLNLEHVRQRGLERLLPSGRGG